MDKEELLKLLENDLDEDFGDDDDDENLVVHLVSRGNRPLSVAEDEPNDDWDLLMQSSMEVNLQFENYSSVVNEDLPNLDVSTHGTAVISQTSNISNLSSDDNSSLAVLESFVGVMEKNEAVIVRLEEVEELMLEILAAVERTAPIVITAPLQPETVAIDMSSLPKEFIEMDFEAAGIIPGGMEYDHLSQVAKTLVENNSEMNAILKKEIELEEARIREAEDEAQRMVERDLALRLARKQRRDEEMTRVRAVLRTQQAIVRSSHFYSRKTQLFMTIIYVLILLEVF